jgi:hypothetical protein
MINYNWNILIFHIVIYAPVGESPYFNSIGPYIAVLPLPGQPGVDKLNEEVSRYKRLMVEG